MTKDFDYNRFTKRYLLALLLIALIVTGAFAILKISTPKQNRHVQAINLSSRQETLTQRIAYLSIRLTKSADEDSYQSILADLSETIELMKLSHQTLLKGSKESGGKGIQSARFKRLYYQNPINLNKRIENFLQHARSLVKLSYNEWEASNAHFEAIQTAANGDMAHYLKRAQLAYQQLAKESTAQIGLLTTILWIIIICTLLLEIFLIFRPQALEMVATTERLKGQNEEGAAELNKLKTHQAELKSSVRILRNSLNAIADGYMLVDSETREVQFNEQFTELWQLPDPLVLSKNFTDLKDFILNQMKEPENFQKQLTENELTTTPLKLELTDGRVIECQNFPQQESDKAGGNVWIFREITSSSIAEAGGRTAEEEKSVRTDASRPTNESQLTLAQYLNSVEEGVFRINRQFVIDAPHSKMLEKMLNQAQLANQNFIDVLKKLVPDKTLEMTRDYLELIFQNSMNQKFFYKLNPLKTVQIQTKNNKSGRDSTYLEFQFHRVIEDDAVSHVIITVKDITAQVRLGKQLEKSEEKTQRQIAFLTETLKLTPSMLEDFVIHCEGELGEIYSVLKKGEYRINLQESLQKISRAICNIKRDAASLNLKLLEEEAQRLQATIEQLQAKKEPNNKDLQVVAMGLDDLYRSVREIKKLVHRLSRFSSDRDKREHKEFESILMALEQFIQRMSEEFDKKVRFEWDKFQSRELPVKYRQLVKDILMQLSKYAIVQGIESPTERKKLNKPAVATLQLESINHGSELYKFKLRDDGRGLPFDQLRKTAIAKGMGSEAELQNWSREKLAKLIFEPGFSIIDTMEKSPEMNTGLTVLLKQLEKYGGTINILSQPDQYCEYVISLPAIHADPKSATAKLINKKQGQNLNTIIIDSGEQ